MLGVLSNSAGRSEVVAAAVNLFVSEGATMVMHCGDVGGRHVLDPLAALDGGFVWGDRDTDRMGLMRYGHGIGVRCFGIVADFEMQGKRIVAVHGDDKKVVKKLLDEQQYDYLLLGHEMALEDRMVGKTRVLNPGPLHGGTTPSAILLEVESGVIRIVTP
jgi:predicted phosphodiesterase